MLKRVAAIHDISGFGKCSLTVALPILSAAGVETSVMPTAVLSTHTGGFEGFTYRDLTSDLRPFLQHWRSLNIRFDAFYSGFLGSFDQLDIVSEAFAMFEDQHPLKMVDPVMADNGQLYKIYTPEMASGMARLCRKADLVIPNITEAVFMLGQSYREGPYTKEYIEKLVRDLSAMGPSRVVLTGVYYNDSRLGAVSYERSQDQVIYTDAERIEGYYHGTGDVFGSIVLAGLMGGMTLAGATALAVQFTYESIRRTRNDGTDLRFGVDFETGLSGLASRIHGA